MIKHMILLLIFLFMFAGCSNFEKIPGGEGTKCTIKNDCLPGFDCFNGMCTNLSGQDIIEAETVTNQDVKQEIRQDAKEIEEDTHNDIPDIRDHDDGGLDILEDEGIAEDISDTNEVTDIRDAETSDPDGVSDVNDVEIQEVMGVDVPAGLPMGSPCATDSECSGNHCIDTVAGRICSDECSNKAPCDPGYQCLPVSITPEGYEYLCKPWPDNLCKPCIGREDCPDGYACYESLNENFCTRPCEEDACPTGFDCAPVDALQAMVCLPATGICECDNENKGTDALCEVTNDAGTCVGTITCGDSGNWSVCTALIPEQEQCDGKDNNCDGNIDEAFTFTDWDGTKKKIGDTCGTGVCVSTVECRDKDSVWCPGTDKALNKELCGDGLDNDCNGKIDEGCENLDPDGDGYTDDDCGPRDASFHPGAYEPCCPLSVPKENELKQCDRNCDGKVTHCANTDHDNDGFSPPDDCDDNDPHRYPGAPEKCGDNVDQDCDGSDVACSSVRDLDHDGYFPPADCNDNDDTIHPWVPEKCDYIDDNCNGSTDEGNPEGGASCGTNVGECHTGVMVCSHYPHGVKLECLGAKQPGTEVCNGLDDDCNGKTDELWPDKGVACDGSDFDKCKNGTFTCKADGSGLECVNESITDILEACGNHVDDDCDGMTDEGCFPLDIDGDGYIGDQDCNNYRADVYKGAKEACCPTNVPQAEAVEKCDMNCDGKVTYCADTDYDNDGFSPPDDCDDNDPHRYPGAPEKCGDGVDQDCDGVDIPCDQITDKDGDGYYPPIDCNDKNADIHPWAVEKCNYIDDDCNGVIDDGNPEGGVGPCGLDVGECKPGITVCVHFMLGARVECVPKQARQAEVCDGLDNDCDGKTDEDWTTLGNACDGPDDDKCEYGTIVCSDDHKGTTCSQELVENIKELCDGIDNDCDGLTDEGFVYQGLGLDKDCYGIGACGPGSVECSTSKQKATCSTNPDGSAPEATKEICDGIDNDCDGLTDEDQEYMGNTVNFGDTCDGIGECGIGTIVCSSEGNVATCSTDPDGTTPEASIEKCDGMDNDCNGITDDKPDISDSPCKKAGVCEGYDISKCVDGKWTCDYSQVPDYEENTEKSCDGLDNNCNGLTDEDFTYMDFDDSIKKLGDTCGTGACADGIVQCSADKTIADCSTIKNKTAEKCNNQDDDCDGLTDEDFTYIDFDDSTKKLGDTCGTGVCTGGLVKCVDEDTAGCSTLDKASKEECDGMDNDCDGLTDETFTIVDWDGTTKKLGDLCGTGVCAGGLVACTSKKTAGCSSQTKAGPETCNNLDDDCNGKTDDNLQTDISSCLHEGVCVNNVTANCTKGFWVCDYSGVANYEADTELSCDGLDNNCNGSTDEPWPELGNKCDGPDSDECENGTYQCTDDKKMACVETVENIKEKCWDNVDNDCNGLTDEEGATGCRNYYYDGDNDTYGDKTKPAKCLCNKGDVEKYTTRYGGDCNDSDANIHPGADEIVGDGIDNNCDGTTE